MQDSQHFQFLRDPKEPWCHFSFGDDDVWIKGYFHRHDVAEIARQASGQTKESVNKWLDSLNGLFSIIRTGPKCSFAASDIVRSYPLIWTIRNDAVIITGIGRLIEEKLGLGPSEIDPTIARAFARSGFTISDRTLYREVKQIGPGTCLWLEDGRVVETRYHRWKPWNADRGTTQARRGALANVNDTLVSDLIESLAGRQALVPLSAGLDSRFIASGLKAHGYTNVLCVAYGQPGNREVGISKGIAQRLGFDWHLVPFDNKSLRDMYRSDQYRDFVSFSDSLTSVHFTQDYFAIDRLLKEGLISKETVVVNGQSGDFIAGNHIPKELHQRPQDNDLDLRRILEGLLVKHYGLWRCLNEDNNNAEISEVLQSVARTLISNEKGHIEPHGLYEAFEFEDRQSKYVVNGQRCYEYHGLEWRLPLWERRYMDFWEHASLEEKKAQTLYRETLVETNWGGVWKDIAVNPQVINPPWIRPIRLIAKALHAPFGRHQWHKFERRYLEYYMAATCSFAKWPYSYIATEKRGFRNSISFHVEEYLADKGIDLQGQVIG